MRILFAGTPEFAAYHLKALLDAHYNIVAVLTQPDKPVGRGQKVSTSPVKQVAITHDLPVHQPLSLRDPNTQRLLASYQPDIMVVVAYGLILPQAVLNLPARGCLNVHASLLPRWRGAAPIQHAILAGDTQTGISIMQMEAGLDTGPVLSQTTCEIKPEDTTGSLHDRLAHLGGETLLNTLKKLMTTQDVSAVPQDNQLATFAKKIQKSDAKINWTLPAEVIARQIRAFQPWPIAYTLIGNEMIRIWKATVIEKKPSLLESYTAPGTILQASTSGIEVATGSYLLRLQQLQFPGGKILPVQDILNSKKEFFLKNRKLG